MNNLKRAVDIWWREKYLWIFGIIVAFFSMSNSTDSSSSENSNRISILSEDGLAKVKEGFNLFMSATDVVIWVVVFILFILFIVGAIYLAGKAKTALIMQGMKHYKDDAYKITFKEAWDATGDYWQKLLYMNFLVALPFLLIVLVVAGIILLMAFTGSFDSSGLDGSGFLLCCLLCPIIIIVIALSITASFVKDIAAREIVLNNKGVVEALKYAFYNFIERPRLYHYIVSALIFMLPSIAFLIVVMIVMAPAGIVSVVIIESLKTNSIDSTVFYIVTLIIEIGMMALGALVGGPLTALYAIYWNIVYDQLNNGNIVAKVNTEETIKVE